MQIYFLYFFRITFVSAIAFNVDPETEFFNQCSLRSHMIEESLATISVQYISTSKPPSRFVEKSVYPLLLQNDQSSEMDELHQLVPSGVFSNDTVREDAEIAYEKTNQEVGKDQKG